MFWLTIPTIEEVRGRIEKFETQLVNGVGGEVIFPVRYTDNAAPEGNDESYKLRVWAEVVGTGPDCDGTRGTAFVICAQVAEGAASLTPAQVSYSADEQGWRDTIVALIFQTFGYNEGLRRGKEQGAKETEKFWVEQLVAVTAGAKR